MLHLYAKKTSPMKWLLLSKFTVQTFTQFLLSLISNLYPMSANACGGDYLGFCNGRLAEANRIHDRLIEVA